MNIKKTSVSTIDSHNTDLLCKTHKRFACFCLFNHSKISVEFFPEMGVPYMKAQGSKERKPFILQENETIGCLRNKTTNNMIEPVQ